MSKLLAFNQHDEGSNPSGPTISIITATHDRRQWALDKVAHELVPNIKDKLGSWVTPHDVPQSDVQFIHQTLALHSNKRTDHPEVIYCWWDEICRGVA